MSDPTAQAWRKPPRFLALADMTPDQRRVVHALIDAVATSTNAATNATTSRPVATPATTAATPSESATPTNGPLARTLTT